ncbi:MAG: thioredoxin family protein [Pseudobdellovibrionaceae bacterium]
MINSEPHPFFKSVRIEKLDADNFDKCLSETQGKLVGVFFWGPGCPNCEVAKNRLHQEADTLNAMGLNWFHVNVYENFDLGTRFGLYGIPTFLFFQGRKKLGKISPFPGLTPFFDALRGLKER